MQIVKLYGTLKQSLYVSRCKSFEIRLFNRKLSGRKRGFKCITQKSPQIQQRSEGVNWTEIESFFAKNVQRQTHITGHYSAELQTAKQTLTTLKTSSESTNSDFPCGKVELR